MVRSILSADKIKIEIPAPDEVLISPDYTGEVPLIVEGDINYADFQDYFRVIVKNSNDFRGPIIERDGKKWLVGALKDGTLIYFTRVTPRMYAITKDFQEYRYVEFNDVATITWDKAMTKRPTNVQVIPSERKVIIRDDDRLFKFSKHIHIRKLNNHEYKIYQDTSGFSTIIDTSDDRITATDKLQEAAMLYYPVTLLYEKFNAFAKPVVSTYKGDWLAVIQKLFSDKVQEHVNKPNSTIRVDRDNRIIKLPQGYIDFRAWPTDMQTRKTVNRAIAELFRGKKMCIIIQEKTIMVKEKGIPVLRVKKNGKVHFVFPGEGYRAGNTMYMVDEIYIYNRDNYDSKYIPAWAVQKFRNFEDLSDVDWKLGLHHIGYKDYEVQRIHRNGIRLVVPFNDKILKIDPFDIDVKTTIASETIKGAVVFEFPTTLTDVKEIRKDRNAWVYRSISGTELRITDGEAYIFGRKVRDDEWEVVRNTGSIDSIIVHNL